MRKWLTAILYLAAGAGLYLLMIDGRGDAAVKIGGCELGSASFFAGMFLVIRHLPEGGGSGRKGRKESASNAQKEPVKSGARRARSGNH